jgi:hypothetical protein
MNRKTTNTIQNTPMRKTMTVTGKHKEILTELLIYYLNKNYPEMNYSSISDMIRSVKKRDAFGEHWIKHYIDNGNKYINKPSENHR